MTQRTEELHLAAGIDEASAMDDRITRRFDLRERATLAALDRRIRQSKSRIGLVTLAASSDILEDFPR
jgi:hypothetical protein